jgi:hypothetical protein
VHLAKHHLELLLHKQLVFSGHQPPLNNPRPVRYSGVVLLAHLEPLLPSLLRAHLEPLGNTSPPRALVLARTSLAEALRSRSLNSNNPLHLVPLVNLNNNLSNNNNNNQLQAPVLVSLVEVHSGNRSLVQDLEAPSVNQVGACS